MRAPRCFLIAAGGTGGHLFPAQALAEALQKRGAIIELASDDRALKYGGDFPARATHAFASATPTGAGLASKARAALTLGRGAAAALLTLVRLRPRAVIGFGGYPTVPPVLAASLLGIPTLIHEANPVLGRANRFLAPRVGAIATGFAQIKGLDARLSAKVRFTGNPVRPAVLAAAQLAYPATAPGCLNLLITGGSQGARIMADVAPAALAMLSVAERAGIALVQQARGEDRQRVAAACAQMNFSAEIAEFFSDLPARIAAAHLVIGRAGASTIAELGVIGRASILVPFPHALDQDQAANAASLAKVGAALVVPQDEFTPDRLAALLRQALQDPESLRRQGAAAKSAAIADAAERLADLALAHALPA